MYGFTNLIRKVLIVWHALGAPDFFLRDESCHGPQKKVWTQFYLGRRILYARNIPLRHVPSISSELDRDQID